MVAAATHRRERTHQQCSKIWTQLGDAQFDIYAQRRNFEFRSFFLSFKYFRLAAKMALAHQGVDIDAYKAESKR